MQTRDAACPSPWLRVASSRPPGPLPTPVDVLRSRDAGFHPCVRPQRRGGSRAAQTFVPVDPGRVILAILPPNPLAFLFFFHTDRSSVVSPRTRPRNEKRESRRTPAIRRESIDAQLRENTRKIDEQIDVRVAEGGRHLGDLEATPRTGLEQN